MVNPTKYKLYIMIIVAAVVMGLLFVAIVLVSLAYHPRLWIQDFPAPIQEEMEPLSRGERIGRVILAILLLIVVVGIPVASTLNIKSSRGNITILEGFLHIWLLFMVINLIDLVIVDWTIGVWWQPDFLSTPEINPLLHHNTYRFHFVEHLKGTVMLTLLALLLGVIMSF